MMDESPSSNPGPGFSALPDPLTPPSGTYEDLTSLLNRRVAETTGVPPAYFAEFWESCVSCCAVVAEISGGEPLYTCEGCRCKVWPSRTADSNEMIIVWHGRPPGSHRHETRAREHTAETCKQWAADDRSPDVEQERKVRERASIPE